ncbi:glycoside hydrolase family 97 protein [Sphingomonas rhizophila]|uniref:Glycoside hydrolase family 97 protein n=1 Tax=Sphingomonas rhizophila TaxID=2071607 RepID=A0A7G9SBY0_9SPHN|nr:glycoside hydrolase family 97 protein [Sphingomonas rhizophila]QNN65355.1 glycoside hydrolase family 97 protein [Sphingomonas rhizophila]
MRRLIMLMALASTPSLAFAQQSDVAPQPQTDVAQATQSGAIASATSPDGQIKVELSLNGEGRAGYAVTRAGRPVITESHMGFLLTDAPQLLRNFRLVSSSTSDHDDTWQQPWGEWKSIRNHYRQLTATFEEKTSLKRRITVEFRIFNDGVGFRYLFPDQPNLKTVNIAEELTQFAVAQDGKAWWAPAFESNREEYLNENTAISGIGTGQTPLTMVLADGTHLSIHEAALVDYSGMNVARSTGTQLKAVLTPSSTGAKVSRLAPFSTPWRTLLITGDAPSLYHASKIILNLNEPNKLGDVSWFKPMKYAGIWWGMHLDTQSWNSGPKHGATTAYAKKMIDFAAANNMSGLLVEGWNVGWDGDWFATGWDFSFTKPYPDFDIREVAAYGKSKGVMLIGHHETSANIANYEAQMGAAFDLDKSLGIHAVKTGYVSDAGGVQARGPDGKIRFEWHEGQVMSRHHLKVVTEAAKRQVAINAHEPIKDTGLRRTYPNWISREGQRGMEYNAWGVPKNPPKWESEIFFGRMLGGPFDFTPGVVSLKGRGDTDILSTLAKQLALYLVIYSPVQMAADLPENYEKEPVALDFIRRVPVDWDDTRVLGGAVGDSVVVARLAKGTRDWWVGGVTDENARDLAVPLAFLPKGQRFTAEIWRDGPTASFGAKGHDMVKETRTVTAADTLTLRAAPGGGFALKLSPARRK